VTTVHVVVPGGIDDPARPSGGNRYDRRVCDGLRALGWAVREHPVPGAWPEPASLTDLARVLAGVPDGAVVLVDGLLGGAAAVLVPAAQRLRMVLLVHMPLGGLGGSEGLEVESAAVLGAARAVVTTSGWTRDLLLARYPLRVDRVHVAHPGVDPAAPAVGTPGGRELLCVAVVAPHKGQDVLLGALATITDRPWRATLVGGLDRDPGFVEQLRKQARVDGIADRVRFAGPHTGADLARSYATADLLVHASHAETYGMVVTEALAHGLPVVATEVGGLSEALGHGLAGVRPGLLVPPDDPPALGAALARWLDDDGLRRTLRRAARERRATLPGWPATAARIARVLAGAAG